MELIRGLHNLSPQHRGCVLTIGTFDGVHLGHRAVIAQLDRAGRSLGLPRVLMTFEPTPAEFFTGVRAPSRLTRLREKLELLSDLPLDRVLCARFNQTFANLTASEFIERILLQGLDVRMVSVGDDFRFGHHAQGNFALLEQYGARYGFSVIRHDTYCHNGERVSSSRIRSALADGNLLLAASLLGRPYQLSGRVCYGNQLGRTIGFPTANIPLHRRVAPLAGVFAVWVYGLDARPWPGVANIGSRPTINGQDTRLEVHLFDFNRQIYGQHLRVEFVQRLRPEQRFPSFDALRAQIVQDSVHARTVLNLPAHSLPPV